MRLAEDGRNWDVVIKRDEQQNALDGLELAIGGRADQANVPKG